MAAKRRGVQLARGWVSGLDAKARPAMLNLLRSSVESSTIERYDIKNR